MNRSGQTEHRSWIPAVFYLLCSLGLCWFILAFQGTLQGFAGSSGSPGLVVLLLVAPAVVGLALQLAGRRFWAWPFVYLLALYLTHISSVVDQADSAYYYASQVAIVLTVAVGEILGLSLGRWFNRLAGLGYFLAAAACLLVYGVQRYNAGGLEQWQGRTLTFAGAMFLVQTALQGYNYRRTVQVADSAGTEEKPPGTEPAAAKGATGLSGETEEVQQTAARLPGSAPASAQSLADAGPIKARTERDHDQIPQDSLDAAAPSNEPEIEHDSTRTNHGSENDN